MAVRAILFDLFDTLVDLHMDRLPIVELGGRRIPSTLGALHEATRRWVDIDFESFVAALRASDRELHRSHHARGLELPTLKRFDEFCRSIDLTDAEAPQLLTETHMGRLREQIHIPPHHRDILAGMRQRQPLGLVSNFSHSPLALGVLEEAGMDAHLDAVVISDAVGVRKPRREIFDEALRRLDVAHDEVLHVGDNLDADVRGAGELGIRTVWITRRIANPRADLAEHEGPAPTHTITDLAELPGLVEALD